MMTAKELKELLKLVPDHVQIRLAQWVGGQYRFITPNSCWIEVESEEAFNENDYENQMELLDQASKAGARTVFVLYRDEED